MGLLKERVIQKAGVVLAAAFFIHRKRNILNKKYLLIMQEDQYP